MKKLISLFIIVLLAVACKNPTTTPNNPSTPNVDGERVTMVTIQETQNSIVGSLNTIKYSYDDKGRILKISYNFEYNGQNIEDNLNFEWGKESLKRFNKYDTLEFLLNNNNCIFSNGMTYEYVDNYLSKVVFKKGVKLNDYTVLKDTFNTFIWKDGNLVSDGYNTFEYYNEFKNNSFFDIYAISLFSIPTDNTLPIHFNLDPFSLDMGGGFFQNNFGLTSINLVKKVSNKDLNNYDASYKFDSHSRVIEMQMKGKDDVIVYKYTWSK